MAILFEARLSNRSISADQIVLVGKPLSVFCPDSLGWEAPFSVLPRLRFCAIIAKKNYDMTKTVPAGHLAHMDFWPVAGLESVSCVENSHAENNFVFHWYSHSCNGCFEFLNCTGTSVQ